MQYSTCIRWYTNINCKKIRMCHYWRNCVKINFSANSLQISNLCNILIHWYIQNYIATALHSWKHFLPSWVPNMWSFAASTTTTAVSSNNTHVPTLIVTGEHLLCCFFAICRSYYCGAKLAVYIHSEVPLRASHRHMGFHSKMEMLQTNYQHL